MDAEEARRLARIRLFNVLVGDVQTGGIATALAGKGCSEEDILAASQAYEDLIEEIREHFADSSDS